MVKVRCKKENCGYEQEWEGRDFSYFVTWMAKYIAANHDHMTCLHQLEEVTD